MESTNSLEFDDMDIDRAYVYKSGYDFKISLIIDAQEVSFSELELTYMIRAIREKRDEVR